MTPRESGVGDARIALVVSWVIVVVVAFQGIASMLSQTTDELTLVTRVLGVIASVVCASLFIVVQSRTIRQQSAPRWMAWTVVGAATIGFAVGAWLNAALALAIFSLVLTVRRLAVAVPVYCVLIGAFMLTRDIPPITGLFYVLVVLTTGLLLYALTRLALAVEELLIARETVARLRVDEERHRIYRDLHDVLGRSLVAISLRVQTAIRLIRNDTDACATQLDEVAHLVSSGQAELRALTRGEPILGFAGEVATAISLFERLGVECEVDIGADSELDPATDQLAARVVRECITNALKHSRPSTVEIARRAESTATVLVLINDGADSSHGSTHGTGLTDLAGRIEKHGGTLEAAHLVRGRFRVIARLPHSAPTPPETTVSDDTSLSGAAS